MNTSILSKILTKRIPLINGVAQFQLRGIEVVFFDPDEGVNKPAGSPHESPYNTPANRAIVEDVIANYDTLEAAYLAEQQAIKDLEAARKAAKAQAIIDNLPSWAEVDTVITNATTIAALKVIIRKMARILYWFVKDSET